jgi:hypothetical protein
MGRRGRVTFMATYTTATAAFLVYALNMPVISPIGVILLAAGLVCCVIVTFYYWLKP